MQELIIDYGPAPFRFFHYWFNLNGFDKIVEDTWKSLATVDSNVQSKLSDIDIILDQDSSNEEILSDRSLLLKELNDINSIDSLEAAQKSKVRWAIEGDENTKFFHGILNNKHSQLTIYRTLVDGEWIVDMLSLEQQNDLEQNVSNKILEAFRTRYCGNLVWLDKILKKFKMENSKHGSTQMQEKPDYRKSQGAQTPSEVKCMQNVPYALAIGYIMYAVRCTRPNVVFAQNICSRFQQNSGDIYWAAAKTILEYLRNTKDMVLVYGVKPEFALKVNCYSDAGFQTDKNNNKSQSRYVFLLNGGAVD
ncbi:hypothetical protein Tco_1055617 [Tanacetum coccineum]|uniref:Reverse transcriptase Ty1/copia-type domain-containing protein n=1 Tax=Tanacetum coccineum TaxID=301880 RepID=A0ABQ5H071_9ASTR